MSDRNDSLSLAPGRLSGANLSSAIDIEHHDEASGHKYHEFPSPPIIASEELTERVDTP